jgi:hypothetical protein
MARIFIRERAMLKTIAKYLTHFLQFGQTSFRLIGIRRVRMFFYDLPIKFRSLRGRTASLPDARYPVNLSLHAAATHRRRPSNLFEKLDQFAIARHFP